MNLESKSSPSDEMQLPNPASQPRNIRQIMSLDCFGGKPSGNLPSGVNLLASLPPRPWQPISVRVHNERAVDFRQFPQIAPDPPSKIPIQISISLFQL